MTVEPPITQDVDYVPIDFDAYSIPDLQFKNTKDDQNLKNEDKIWRISSLTASVDDETKILILPLPESKRKVKIADTFYQLSTVKSLISRSDEVEKALIVEKDVVKRFEDKTQEEIEQD